MGRAESIQFHVNGRPYIVDNPEFGVSLNTWLRSSARLTGTKVMCAEGGCGVCVVMVTRPVPGSSDTKSFAANSCLFPLLSADGCHITTTEGLIEEGGTYNSIQERVAHFNATQCGYCTPGFVMTMYSFLKCNPKPTQAEIEEQFDGNLCRCTGYRPIFDAMKSFASDADPKLKQICQDIEDLKGCRQECKDKAGDCYSSCGRYDADGCKDFMHKDKTLPTLKPQFRSLELHPNVGGINVRWLRPASFQELKKQVKLLVLDGKKDIRFVVGYTSTGIFKDEDVFDAYIDSKGVEELYEISDSDDTLTIGANVVLSDLIQECQSRASQSEIFPVLAKHIKKIAHVPVRNVGSWAGNLMIKKLHPEFPSDVATLFSAFNVAIVVHDCITDEEKEYFLTGQDNFMSLDIAGKVIVACKIPKTKPPSDGIFKALSYKVMPRSQNAHAYVNAAFSASIVDSVVQNISISFGGISKDFLRAENTENYLVGKTVNSQQTLTAALECLNDEIRPISYSDADSSPEYRKSLALGLFYKFSLYLCELLPGDLVSAIDTIDRPLTSSTRTFDSDSSMFPITEPIPKLSAIKQASGEAKFLSDSPLSSDELCATFVMAEIGNADIDSIDFTVAETMPGFRSIITASDLPPQIKNTFTPPPNKPQVIIADGHVDFAGQPVAIVLADTEFHAEEIAKSVTVTYKNVGEAVYSVEEAVDKNMIYEGGDHFEQGDADSALENAKVKISGRVRLGPQYHFYMETQIAKAIPTEDGFQLKSATQWQDGVQSSCAYILGWDSNRIDVSTVRIGGAYGGKAMSSWLTASIALISSYISGRPVRFHATMSRCMETFGKRSQYVVDYNVGVNEEGVLQAIEATYYTNSGASPNDWEFSQGVLPMYSDCGYHCPNWKLTAKNVRTNMASTTWCRAPLTAQLSVFMEMVLEHVASAVKQDPIAIKQRNLYKEGEIDISGTQLTNLKLREISQNLLDSASAAERQKAIDAFNAENRWKKRGLGFVPIKYMLSWEGGNFSSQVSIFASDGSVILSTGAVDSGQGISTKLIQVASYVLGVPMDLIRISRTDVFTTPNSAPTSTSFTSEICSQAILECCKKLKSRIDETSTKLDLPSDITWKEKIAKCFAEGVDLTASYWLYPKESSLKKYNICGAGLSEVEMDILTGEYAVRRVDILYDCGKSVNPEIDVGQAEGAFVFGLGYYLTEKMAFQAGSGKLLSHNTWEYKPPASKDIPTEWNITFWKDESSPRETLSSKAVGEPPLLLSSSAVFAIKRCIENFRSKDGYFAIDIPASVDNVQQLCGIAMSDYKLEN